MTYPDPPHHERHTDEHHADRHQTGAHRSHNWMMIACCIPMLVIALALVATGVLSGGFLLFVVACTAMMFLMMRGMSHGNTSDR